jgi:glycine hydroxymethyltransferase
MNRQAHNGDPVVDKDGKSIGWVTSCAVDAEGFLTGQAYLELKYTSEGTPIFVYQGGVTARPPTPTGRRRARR